MIDLLRQLLGGIAPDWLVTLIAYLIVTTVLLVVAAVMTMALVWIERRGVARMQDRLGPNRVGPEGSLQLVADTVKLFTKEDIVPANADRWVHLLAPMVALSSVAFSLAVVPWGRGVAPAEIDTAALFVAAVSAVSGVGLMMAGWGSNNKFALLGAMRAVAQLVSYEIPGVTALLGAVLLAGTMSLTRIAEQQAGLPIVGTSIPGAWDLGLGWNVFTPVGLLGFVIFYICVLAEGERTPFDIPEADSEIVAGYMTEYSGMKFALFFLGQYILNFVLSMVAAILFLGGWQGPGVAWLASLPGWGALAAGVLSVLYLVGKAVFLVFCMVWIRGTFPRLRVDQLMGFAWKYLLPLALVNLASAALWVAITRWSAEQWSGVLSLDALAAWQRTLLAFAVTAAINVAAFYWIVSINQRRAEEEPLEELAVEPV
ncbi:MAG TPA: NADH-quinone oxidoreductase subunit NuoH [Roseiflexaceae bacterium]|nr:NADH-quinone oxidoreductase subunit NuoH [Roseiflexaceae bacterium]